MKTMIVAVAGVLLPAVAAFSAQPQMGYRAVANEELSSAVNYWTPARMAAAIPRDLLDASAAGSQPTQMHAPTARVSAPGGDSAAQGPDLSLGAANQEEDGVQPLQYSSYPYPFTRYFTPNGWKNTYPYKTVGKLFFSIGGSGFVCSASVIRPHLLLTARHCIYDYGTARWATNVTFYPGYEAGASNPTQGGAWYARILATWTSNASTYDYDIGFIQTFRKNGGNCAPDSTHRQIESYTGYLGWSYGGDFNQKHWDDFGYPQAAPFNGQNLVQCEAGTGAVNVFGYNNTLEWGCDTTGGTSGGPALTGFVPGVSGAANYANSLNSFKFTSPNHSLALNGPQFQQYNFYNLLVFAQNLSCPA